MFDFLRWNKAKLDAPPGSLIYSGEGREFVPFVHQYAYTPETLIEHRCEGDLCAPKTEDGVNLVIMTGIHRPELVNTVSGEMDMSRFHLEDILNTGQRSKFTWADDEAGFLVMKHMTVDDEGLSMDQVSIFWRQDVVMVFLETASDLLDGVVSRIKKGKGKIRRADANYLVAAILDSLVDNQMLALTHFSDQAQELEEDLATDVSDELLGRLYELKRETILLRNELLPVRDIFKTLLREDSEIPDDAHDYLDDIAGHHEQTIEGATSLHDILKSMIDYQISLIGIRTNRVMQFLTVIATIFIPLTFIAGVYGMNFSNMPELQWEYGYYIIMGLMAVIGVGMFWFFRSRKYF